MKSIYILLLLSFTIAFGQNNSKYQFAKNVFKEEYKPQTYEPYKGQVTVVDNNTIKYDEQVLLIPKLDDEYKGIFLHHANLFASNEKIVVKSEEEISAMTETERFFYNLSRNDSIHILYFDELEQLNPNSKTKRFIFWRTQGNMMNPTECYFELQNDRATKRTPLSEFIRGAKLTFFYWGTIIL